jgi:ketosteroid isomerase-like protein
MDRRSVMAAHLIPFVLALAACTTLPAPMHRDKATQQVFEVERAFAKTMADRDHSAFVSLLSDEAVFFSGEQPLRGKAAVTDWWKRYFEKPAAPFSWAPEKVEVIDSGKLALSTGPVYDPNGKKVASFTSIWRLEAPSVWRIIFDQGCECVGR